MCSPWLQTKRSQSIPDPGPDPGSGIAVRLSAASGNHRKEPSRIGDELPPVDHHADTLCAQADLSEIVDIVSIDDGRDPPSRQSVDGIAGRPMGEVDHRVQNRALLDLGGDRSRVPRWETGDTGRFEQPSEDLPIVPIGSQQKDRRASRCCRPHPDECRRFRSPPCKVGFVRLGTEHTRRTGCESEGIYLAGQGLQHSGCHPGIGQGPTHNLECTAEDLERTPALFAKRLVEFGTELDIEERHRPFDCLRRRSIQRVSTLGKHARHVVGEGRNEGGMESLRNGDHGSRICIHRRWARLTSVRPTTIPRGHHMKRLVLLIAGIALLAVACRAEVNVLVDINEDRSGTAAFEFGLDEEFLGLIESSGGSADDLFGEMNLGADEGVATVRTEGDMTFTGVTKDFTDVNEAMDELTGVTGSEDPLFQDFSFTMDDETAELTAKASTPEEALGDVPFDASALTGDVFAANFILGMPGTVVEHNADEVMADGRLRWDLPILGGDKDVYAKSEFGGSSLWWLWIVLGVVLVLGVIAIIAAVVLGKRQSKQAVSDAAAQYPQPAVGTSAESKSTSPDSDTEVPDEPDTEVPEDAAPLAESDEVDTVDPSDDEDDTEQ